MRRHYGPRHVRHFYDTRPKWHEIPLEPVDPEEIEEVRRAKTAMNVYDAAPPKTRARTREKGEAPLLTWWRGLNPADQHFVLLGEKPLGPRATQAQKTARARAALEFLRSR